MGPLLTSANDRTTGRAGTRRTRSVLIVTSLTTLLAMPALAAETVQRYTVEAEVRPMVVSVDGRFGLDATARYAPEAKSSDGRFVLKAVNVPEGGCNAASDLIFADDFE